MGLLSLTEVVNSELDVWDQLYSTPVVLDGCKEIFKYLI